MESFDFTSCRNPMAALADIIISGLSYDLRRLSHGCDDLYKAITHLGCALPPSCIKGMLALFDSGRHETSSSACRVELRRIAIASKNEDEDEAEAFFCFVGALFERRYICSCSDDVFMLVGNGLMPKFPLRWIYWAFEDDRRSHGARLVRRNQTCDDNCKRDLLAECDKIQADIIRDRERRRATPNSERLDIYRDPNLNINREEKKHDENKSEPSWMCSSSWVWPKQLHGFEPYLQGKKHDSAKPELHRIPAEALNGLADVFAFGAKKYGENNWRKGIESKRLYNAALRHMLAWNEGEKIDADSGLPHIAHAMCNMAMMIALGEQGKQDEP